MLDIRDRSTVLAALRDAERSFEDGALPRLAARDRVTEVADALAESGPLELGVTSGRWLVALGAAESGVASLSGCSSAKANRQTKDALRELQLLFARKLGWRRAVIGWVSSVLTVVFLVRQPIGIVENSTDSLKAAALAGLAAVVIVGLFLRFRRYRPNPGAAATSLDLPDRVLFADVVKAPRREVQSHIRARLGAYVHPVLIATDRRVLLARPISKTAANADTQEFEVAWAIPYGEITSVSSKSTEGERPEESVCLQTRDRDLEYTMPTLDGMALVAILRRRAPGTLGPADEVRIN